jgi:ABC-2 type transport system permease protein
MKLSPGSFPALIAHDIRLSWRSFAAMFGKSSVRTTIAVLLAFGLALHLAAWPAIGALKPLMHGPDASLTPLAGVLGAIFAWMIAQSLFGATRALYDRADLDLLLGSPLPPGRIIAAKAAAIAAGTFGGLAVFLLPIANMGALLDGPGWLGIYPALIGLALIATSIGLGLAIGLFFLVGPVKARLYAQMTGASIGGAFVLGAQIFAVLPKATREAAAVWMDQAGVVSKSGVGGGLWLPLNAVRGDAAAMAALVLLGLMIFVGTVWLLGERFAHAATAAAGAPAAGSRAGTDAVRRFRSGIGRSLRLKEWRLMVRDPSLFAQLGLQIIYTIPIAVVLLRSNLVPAAVALVPTIVVIAAQVAGSIAWITVSGEDAPELIASAPVAAPAVDRAKLSAVVLPVLAIVGAPLIVLATLSVRAAIVAVLFSAGGSACTALLNFWHPMPGNRRGMLRRHQQSKLIGLVEHGLAMLWAFASVFALIGSPLTLAPLGLAAAILGGFRYSQRRNSEKKSARIARHGNWANIGYS